MPKPRILVVDDDPINIKTLIALLEDEFELAAAVNGPMGLKAASTTRPDLILLDITMPDMDGYEVLTELKRRDDSHEIPVVFITGLDSAEDEALGLERGASDYISKPFNPTVVRARVRTQVRLKQQADQLAMRAIQDGLTGVSNRQYIEGIIDRSIDVATQSSQALGLLLTDIDHFKRYNQIYGTDQGDATLKVIAQLIHEAALHLSPAASIGRFDGDSFILSIPGASEHQLKALAHDIRQAIADLRITNKASKHNELLSVSQGCVSVVPDAGSRSEQLVEYAQLAVSSAQELGGNEIVVQKPSARTYWSPPTPGIKGI